jgi:alkylhydroperoxidase family enzyme
MPAVRSSARRWFKTEADIAAASLELAKGELVFAYSNVSDELFEELQRHFDAAQIIELCLTSGWYHAISYVVNAARIPLEPWAARFPEVHVGG